MTDVTPDDMQPQGEMDEAEARKQAGAPAQQTDDKPEWAENEQQANQDEDAQA